MRIERWPLRLRIFLFFALVGLGGAAMVALAGWAAAARIGEGAAEHLVLTSGAAAFGVVLLAGWVWQLFDEHVARPIQRLSGELEARTHGRGQGGLSGEEARYLGELGPAAERLARALGEARGASDTAAGRAISEVLDEKARVEGVLRDLREGVLICNREHEILLYNAEAQRLLGLGPELGLGRSVFRLLSAQPVRHALDRLRNRFRSGRHRTHRDHLSVPLVCATRDGARTLEGRLSLVRDEAGGRIEGYALTLRDGTALIADQTARDALLRDALEGLRRPAANLRAAADILAGRPEPAPADRARFQRVVAEEAARLSARLDALSAAYAELRTGGSAMTDVSSAAIADCLRGRLGGEGPEVLREGPLHWLHADSFTLVELLAHLARRIAGREGASSLAISAERKGAHVFLDLLWSGAAVPERVARDWLGEPVSPALGGLTGRDVLLHHRSETWSEPLGQGRARLRLPLPPAIDDHESAPADVLPARPEFYDFSLLRRGEVPEDIRARPLSALSFVVFDCETTGLFPAAGDEIVQIAGVRVLNGRILPGEAFDRLVDPGRPIPAASTRIHGITDAMVAGAPEAAEVIPAFHDFADGAVLVAHNAPFDLKFLQLKEGVTGRVFDQPVLDTVLLSAHLFGQAEEHTLDALAARFGAEFPEGQRHTALADAVVTAEVLCGMIGALEARGVVTLADALRVSEEAGALRRRQARG